MWLHWQSRDKARTTLAILYPSLIYVLVISKEIFQPTFSENILEFPEILYSGISSRTSSWWCSPSAGADFIKNLTFLGLGSQKESMREFAMIMLQCPTVRQWVLRVFSFLVWEKHIYSFRSCKDELKMLTNTRLCKDLDPSCTVWQSVDVWKPPMYFCSLLHEVPRTIILIAWSTMKLWYSYTYCLLSQQSHAYNIQWAINEHELWMCSQTAPCLSCLVHFNTKEHLGTKWEHQWKWFRIGAPSAKIILKCLSQLFHTDYESFTWIVLSELQGRRQAHRLSLFILSLMFGTGVTTWGSAQGGQVSPWDSMAALISRNSI